MQFAEEYIDLVSINNARKLECAEIFFSLSSIDCDFIMLSAKRHIQLVIHILCLFDEKRLSLAKNIYFDCRITVLDGMTPLFRTR